MMPQLLKEGVYYLGVRDWDRKLFDEFIPLPHGTSYNAYMVEGTEKTALIDTVDPSKSHELISNLDKLNCTNLDYIVSNHAEQDHSGTIPEILNRFPAAKVVTNQKCKQFLIDHLLINENKFITIQDDEELSLGGKTLQFIMTPWVHWPETMCTYLKENQILFSCDLFGSHYATSEIFSNSNFKVLEEAKRYYAGIMTPFGNRIIKHLERLAGLKINFIAPNHGPVYNDPPSIINAYKEWTSENVKNMVVIPYVSMHGSTEKLISVLIDLLTEKGISAKPFNLIKSDIGELAVSLLDAATLIIGTPTFLNGPHPLVVYATTIINSLKPKTKFLSVLGSSGWGGKTVDIIKDNLGNLKAEFLTPIFTRGYPKNEDFESLEILADEILMKHKELEIV